MKFRTPPAELVATLLTSPKELARLSQWEQSYVRSLDRQRKAGQALAPEQLDRLSLILTKAGPVMGLTASEEDLW